MCTQKIALSPACTCTDSHHNHTHTSRIRFAAKWPVLILGAEHKSANRKQDPEILFLQPANVFIDKHHNYKLGDFGLAKVLGAEHEFAKTNVGTPYYMAPEQVNEVPYNEKCDIWSLGCLVYELAAKAPPFEAHNQLALAVKIKAGKIQRLPEPYSVRPASVDSISCVDPTNRKTNCTVISSLWM